MNKGTHLSDSRYLCLTSRKVFVSGMKSEALRCAASGYHVLCDHQTLRPFARLQTSCFQSHPGIMMMPHRSMLPDANVRKPESTLEAIYRDLQATYKGVSSDSRKWLDRLQIIDSTSVTFFSNLIFKGMGRHPKTGWKKGDIKVHANIHTNECVPFDTGLASGTTNDSFMLMYVCQLSHFLRRPGKGSAGTIQGHGRVSAGTLTFRLGGLLLKMNIHNACLSALRTLDCLLFNL